MNLNLSSTCDYSGPLECESKSVDDSNMSRDSTYTLLGGHIIFHLLMYPNPLNVLDNSDLYFNPRVYN